MKKLLIWGASGHATVVADIVRMRGEYEIAAFVDERPKAATSLEGIRVVASREAVLRLRDEEGVSDVIVGFGDCASRLKVGRWCREQRFSLATVLHPSAVMSPSARIGPGTMIAAGAVVNSAATIGESVIVNTGATVDHHCVVGDGCHLSPGVHLGGVVVIGELTWIGVGAAVRDHVTIGGHSIVGVGAAVVSDLPDNVVAYGNPARVVRAVEEARPW
jgi:acetyltransferase EpsM